MNKTLNEEFNFKHYLLGNSVPIRVLTAKSDGLKAGAQIPDRTTCTLVFNNAYLRRVEESPEVEEINEAAFDKACSEFYSKKKMSNHLAKHI